MKLNEIKTFTMTGYDEEEAEKAERLARKRIKTLTLCKDEDICKVGDNIFKVEVNLSNIDM